MKTCEATSESDDGARRILFKVYGFGFRRNGRENGYYYNGYIRLMGLDLEGMEKNMDTNIMVI